LNIQEFRARFADPGWRAWAQISLTGDEAAAVLADDDMTRRWYERALSMPGLISAPASEPAVAPVRRPLSLFAKLLIASPVLLIAAGFIGYSMTQPRAAEKACAEAIETNYGGAFEGVAFTEYYDRGATAIDVRGTYNGGTFACAVSRPGYVVEQALLYYPDGLGEVVIP
jgi:hypothetical protein